MAGFLLSKSHEATMSTELAEAPVEEKLPLEQAIDETAEAEAEAPEEKAEAAPAPIDPATIDEARDMGWVPQDQWKGDPNVWRPADEYVRRGQEVLPIVQSNNRKLKEEARRHKEEIDTLKEQMSSMKGQFEESLAQRTKRLEGMTKAALQSQREQIYKAFEAEKRKAVAEGNTEEYDRLSTEQTRAVSDFKPEADYEEEAPAPVEQKPATPRVPPAVNAWMETNAWFNSDQELTALAAAHHGRLLADMPGISLEENLERTTEYVKSKFPEKFGIKPKPNGASDAPRPHAPAVEGGGRQAQAVTKDKSWIDLPQEAKQAAKTFFDDGLFGADESIEKAQKKYAKQYWEQF